ncbi:MAG: peptidoglycan-binding domain-containing protein [Silanimonas sp.]
MAGDFYIREPLLPGMCGEDVRYLQEGLRIAGFDRVDTNGVFDGRTEAAWRELQIENQLRRYDLPNHGVAAGAEASYAEAVEANLRGRFPDEESLQRAVRANSPWQFDTRQDYENFLRSEPDPFGPGVMDADSVWGEVNARLSATIDPAMRRSAESGVPVDPAVDALAATRDDWYFRHLSGSDENWTFPIENTDIAPPGSDSCLMSDASESLTPPALASHPLYAALRGQLPPDVGDGHVAELTVRAMQDGIASPDQLEQAVVSDRQVAFAVGKTPGFMGQVDLTRPPMSDEAVRAAVNELAAANSAPTPDLEPTARIARA